MVKINQTISIYLSFQQKPKVNSVSPRFYFIDQIAVYSDEKLTLKAAIEMTVNKLQATIRNAKDQFKTNRKDF